MPATAKLSYLRIAPRKVRLVADLVRGKTADDAQAILTFTTNKSSLPLLKLLKQAIANAKSGFQLEAGNLYISKITVDEGPKQKRWMPRARGQAYEIQKKSSHVTIVLDEFKGNAKRSRKAGVQVQTSEAGEKAAGSAAEGKFKKEAKPRLSQEKFKSEMKRKKTDQGLKRIFRRKSI